MFKRIDHVEIVTDQAEQTVEFYTRVLGFRVKARDRIERPDWPGQGLSADRPAAGDAGTGMTGRSDPMRQATTAVARVDQMQHRTQQTVNPGNVG